MDNIKQVHFSIDDVGKSFLWLVRNQPVSLYDMNLYATLRMWHEIYDIKVTLYCFSMLENFLVSEIPDRYRRDFENASDWMKFGFHQKSPVSMRDETIEGIKAGYELFDETMTRLGAGRTDILRVHSWYALPEQKDYLRFVGIRQLLYPDDDCLKYDQDDVFWDCGLLHRRTKVWFEKMDDYTEDSLCIGRNEIAVFTHEWCFLSIKEKIEKAISLYRKNEYCFI